MLWTILGIVLRHRKRSNFRSLFEFSPCRAPFWSSTMSATPTISWPILCRLVVSSRFRFSRANRLWRRSPSDKPDLILLDLMLPDIDGFELCDRLKRARETNLIPIVMVTALQDAHHRATGVRVGANGYLTKPFTPGTALRNDRCGSGLA